VSFFLSFVDRASLYNLVNTANLVHNCLFLFSTCFGRLCAHHQEKQLYLCDTRYLSLRLYDCLVCRVEWNSTLHTWQSSVQNNKYQVSHRYSCFSWLWVHSRPKHVEKRNKHTKKNCAPSSLYLQDYNVVSFCTSISVRIRESYLKELYFVKPAATMFTFTGAETEELQKKRCV
jgi:hypothetical protein